MSAAENMLGITEQQLAAMQKKVDALERENEQLKEDMEAVRKWTKRLVDNNATLRANMGAIHRLLDQRTPSGVQGAKRIAKIYERMNDVPQINQPKRESNG